MVSWEYPPKVIGGLGRHVSALCDAFRDEGVEVTLVTNSNEGDERERHGTLHVVRVREYFPPPLTFAESVAQGNVALSQGIMAVLQEQGPFDVIHAHDWLTAYAARAAKHATNLPLVSTIHATEWGRNGGLYTDEQRHISDIEWWLAFESWRVICCSQAMHGELQRIFQVPADKLRIIPNGVHVPDTPADTPKAPRHSATQHASDEKRLFFVGRLVHEKGVDLLLHAFSRVLHHFPKARLDIAGRGPQEGALQEFARKLGIDTHVHFLGYISDEERNRLYQNAHAAVVPSRYEPFGIVALEAMAYGAPVVVAGTGGLAEVVEHQQTGLVFAPGDADALAEQLVALLSSPRTGERLAESARAVVAQTYDWRSIARETKAVYEEVVYGAKQPDLSHQESLALT